MHGRKTARRTRAAVASAPVRGSSVGRERFLTDGCQDVELIGSHDRFFILISSGNTHSEGYHIPYKNRRWRPQMHSIDLADGYVPT